MLNYSLSWSFGFSININQMTARISFCFLFCATVSVAQTNQPFRNTIETSTRAIRKDVPMTNSIKKAFASGTRDFSGKPGPTYWQLETDFTIEASLDPATQIITGSEKIIIHNNSKDDLKTLALRLDHNIFRADVPRGSSTPAETTDGMIVTSIKIQGKAVDLKATPANNNATPKLAVVNLNRTIATLFLD